MVSKVRNMILPRDQDEEYVRTYCRSCRDESRRLGKPSEKAMNCWKILYSTLDAEKFRKALEISKKAVEYKCWVEYREPDEYSYQEGAIIIICHGKDVMWTVRDYLIRRFLEEKLIDKPYLPYRRAGNYYDKEFGPWRLWGLKYYPEKMPLTELTSVKAVCPNDNVPMDVEKRGIRCGMCGLYIPESILFEAVETGVADVEIIQELHRGEIYRIKYVGADRFIISRLKI